MECRLLESSDEFNRDESAVESSWVVELSDRFVAGVVAAKSGFVLFEVFLPVLLLVVLVVVVVEVVDIVPADSVTSGDDCVTTAGIEIDVPKRTANAPKSTLLMTPSPL